MTSGVAVTFKGGPADRQIVVWPSDAPPEFIDYHAGEVDETSYRHLARPGTLSPYHVYVPFERAEEKVS